jgi:hypothetical protein
MDQKQIDALLVEREGYSRRGMTDHVAQIDEMLVRLGYSSKNDVVETAAFDVVVEQAKSVRGRKRKKA